MENILVDDSAATAFTSNLRSPKSFEPEQVRSIIRSCGPCWR
nr:hypothetical protein [Pseudomonas synxantha]